MIKIIKHKQFKKGQKMKLIYKSATFCICLILLVLLTGCVTKQQTITIKNSDVDNLFSQTISALQKYKVNTIGPQLKIYKNIQDNKESHEIKFYIAEENISFWGGVFDFFGILRFEQKDKDVIVTVYLDSNQGDLKWDVLFRYFQIMLNPKDELEYSAKYIQEPDKTVLSQVASLNQRFNMDKLNESFTKTELYEKHINDSLKTEFRDHVGLEIGGKYRNYSAMPIDQSLQVVAGLKYSSARLTAQGYPEEFGFRVSMVPSKANFNGSLVIWDNSTTKTISSVEVLEIDLFLNHYFGNRFKAKSGTKVGALASILMMNDPAQNSGVQGSVIGVNVGYWWLLVPNIYLDLEGGLNWTNVNQGKINGSINKFESPMTGFDPYIAIKISPYLEL